MHLKISEFIIVKKGNNSIIINIERKWCIHSPRNDDDANGKQHYLSCKCNVWRVYVYIIQHWKIQEEPTTTTKPAQVFMIQHQSSDSINDSIRQQRYMWQLSWQSSSSLKKCEPKWPMSFMLRIYHHYLNENGYF